VLGESFLSMMAQLMNICTFITGIGHLTLRFFSIANFSKQDTAAIMDFHDEEV
jgi:hypothetical protein